MEKVVVPHPRVEGSELVLGAVVAGGCEPLDLASIRIECHRVLDPDLIDYARLRELSGQLTVDFHPQAIVHVCPRSAEHAAAVEAFVVVQELSTDGGGQSCELEGTRQRGRPGNRQAPTTSFRSQQLIIMGLVDTPERAKHRSISGIIRPVGPFSSMAR